ncbi:cupredoxin domain-containing protein [Halopiger goleimassiliensis]|uniref:cupredoxin domain-containing protein n=1 Tax=Halopiger goleimassiliensis TaxID=1293048 RepID=UPI00067770D8|nr:hypothetical protein [Halopiger goleimassiliensis]
MTDNNDQRDDSSTAYPAGVDRRNVLRALGAGTAVAALGSSAAAGADDRENGHSEPADEAIHPVFGFPAPSGEVPPPVEPDHVIEAEIRPRTDREIPEFFFEPTGLAVEPGATIQFTLASPHHSVTAFHPAFGTVQRVPDGVPPFSSPVLPVNAYWLYTFERSGVYDLHCGPHELFGHVFRLVVGEAAGPGAEPLPEPELGAAAAAEGDESPHEAVNDRPGGDEPGTDPDREPDHEDRQRGRPAAGPDDDGEPPTDDPELRPPEGAAFTVLADPALEPERILERGRVSWDEIEDANKRIPL